MLIHLHCLVLILVLLFTRATVSAVSCLAVPVFICITYLIVMCFEIKWWWWWWF